MKIQAFIAEIFAKQFWYFLTIDFQCIFDIPFHAKPYQTIQDLAKPCKTMTKLYPEKMNRFERKDTGDGDKPKDYLLGIGGRLQEVFRAKLGLVPF